MVEFSSREALPRTFRMMNRGPHRSHGPNAVNMGRSCRSCVGTELAVRGQSESDGSTRPGGGARRGWHSPGVPFRLTLGHRLTYTRVVPRVIPVVLGLVLASTSGQVSALHIHAYTDHDHPEHHHGLAAHEHHRSAPHHDEDHDAVHLESCDPGQHAVSVTMGCAPVPHVDAIDAQCANSSLVEPLVPVRSVQPFTDVRVHGPPPLTQAPPRAPPLIFPA